MQAAPTTPPEHHLGLVTAPPGNAGRGAATILRRARWAMVLSAGAMLTAVAMAYPLAAHFSLVVQAGAHLALPVAAGVFKLGYVARLAAHHALGNFNAG